MMDALSSGVITLAADGFVGSLFPPLNSRRRGLGFFHGNSEVQRAEC